MSKLTESARGEECLVRLPGVCNYDPETTVLAHLPWGLSTGVGRKAKDIQATYACSACHDAIDRRTAPALTGDADIDKLLIVRYAYEGHMRTLDIMLSKGLIKI